MTGNWERGWRIGRSVVLMLCLLGCGGGTEPNETAPEERPVVLASNAPLAEVARRLAGDSIELIEPIPQDVGSLAWEPTDNDVLALQNADLVLLNGADHEPWSTQVTLSPLNVSITALGMRDQWIASDKTVLHQHGPQGSQTGSPMAPFTWLDPLLFSEQAMVVTRALQQVMPPDRRPQLEDELAKIQAELQQLDEQWRSVSETLDQQPLLASEPVYQYPAQRYKWNLHSLNWSNSPAPTAQQWAELDELLKSHPASIMLWPAKPSAEIQQQLTSRDIRTVVIDTLTRGMESGQMMEAMARNPAALRAALTQ